MVGGPPVPPPNPGPGLPPGAIVQPRRPNYQGRVYKNQRTQVRPRAYPNQQGFQNFGAFQQPPPGFQQPGGFQQPRGFHFQGPQMLQQQQLPVQVFPPWCNSQTLASPLNNPLVRGPLSLLVLLLGILLIFLLNKFLIQDIARWYALIVVIRGTLWGTA